MTKKLMILGALILLFTGQGLAQPPADAKQLADVLNRLMNTYRKNEGLSYEVRYRYANESTPSAVLDSLKGRVVMLDSTRYWCSLDSTETLVNHQYSMVLFKEDKLMYLAKPQASSLFQPYNMLEKFLLQNKGLTYQQRITGSNKTVRMQFAGSSVCKELVLTIDTLSGYLTKMVYIVPTEQLVEVAARENFSAGPDGYEPFARVEAEFYNYRKIPGDDRRFEESNYFYKEGKRFLPTEPFKDYKIIVATPDL